MRLFFHNEYFFDKSVGGGVGWQQRQIGVLFFTNESLTLINVSLGDRHDSSSYDSSEWRRIYG